MNHYANSSSTLDENAEPFHVLLEQLGSLFNRLKRKVNETNVPPDEETSALGKQTGHIFVSLYLRSRSHARNRDEWKKQGTKILEIFLENSDNGGILASGFFHEIATDPRIAAIDCTSFHDDFIHWWLKWLTHPHDRTLNHSRILAAGICSFVSFSFAQFRYFSKETERSTKKIITDGTNDHFHLVNLYEKLIFSASRQCLIRECVQSAFYIKQKDNGTSSVAAQSIIDFLSPLFYRIIVSSMLSSSSEREECVLFISLIMQKSRELSTIPHKSNDFWMIVDWLTKSVEAILESSFHQASLDHVYVAWVICHDFVRQLCELVTLGMLQQKPGSERSRNLHVFLRSFLGGILPRLGKHSKFSVDTPSLESILEQATTVMIRVGKEGGLDPLPNHVFYNLGIMCLMMQGERESTHVLNIMLLAVRNQRMKLRPYHTQTMVYGVLASVGYIFQSLPSCLNVSRDLIQLANDSLEFLSQNGDVVGSLGESIDDKPCHVFDMFCGGTSTHDEKLESLIQQNSKHDQRFTIENQCESLLLGLSLLCCASKFQPSIETVTSYLNHLIDRYQHLGRRCLPVVVATLQNYIEMDSQSSHDVLSSLLDLMCSSLAKDPSCAHEVWSILSSMAKESLPINVQTMTVRLYPMLCKSNRRLYSRINGSLGKYASHPNPSLRIAAAASLCDLAKDDLIRDVSEIIGWVQSFLTDEDQLVRYFSVTTLYYLIKAEELDFSTVIKVLNKKLVEVCDAQAIVKLPGVVVEAIVKLLGLGQESSALGSEDDSAGDESVASEILISEQMQAAITGLMNLAHHISNLILGQSDDTGLDINASLRILSSIHTSIAKYSFEWIGIPYEMIRGESEECLEYENLKKIIEVSFVASEYHTDRTNPNFDNSLIALCRKLLSFEEEALGPSLWIHKKKNQSFKNVSCHDIAEALKGIPEGAEGTITRFLVNKLVERPESALIHIKRMSLSMACLQVLSLPTSFVRLLRKAMDTDVGEKEILTGCCVELLVAQLKIVRRAAEERREFVKLSIDLAQLPSELFFIELWKHAPQFLESLSTIIPQWTGAVAEELLPCIWSRCNDRIMDDDPFYATAFINSLTDILEMRDKKISPLTLKAIYNVVITEAFPTCGMTSRGDSMESVQYAICHCISKMPLEVLLEYKLFDLTNEAYFRIQLISHLYDNGVLQPDDPHLIRAILWIGKQKPNISSNQECILWKLSFNLSRSALKLPVALRSDILSNLLEIMQVNGVNSANLYLILLLSAIWIQDYPVKFQSSLMFDPSLNLHDQMLGKVCNTIGISSSVMKRVIMLLKSLSIDRTKNDHVLKECFFQIFLSLKNSDSCTLHALVSASNIR